MVFFLFLQHISLPLFFFFSFSNLYGIQNDHLLGTWNVVRLPFVGGFDNLIVSLFGVVPGTQIEMERWKKKKNIIIIIIY